jgi:hypothetical protein
MSAMRMLGGSPQQPSAANSGFSQANLPINLLQQGPPPTVKGIPAGGGPGYRPAGKTTNIRGLNRTGKLNTNTSLNRDGNSNPESALLKSVHNIQRKK